MNTGYLYLDTIYLEAILRESRRSAAARTHTRVSYGPHPSNPVAKHFLALLLFINDVIDTSTQILSHNSRLQKIRGRSTPIV